jgi:hypothetical protein
MPGRSAASAIIQRLAKTVRATACTCTGSSAGFVRRQMVAVVNAGVRGGPPERRSGISESSGVTDGEESPPDREHLPRGVR